MKESISHPTPTAADPYGDAGMDNPPEVDAETIKIWANMRADDAGRMARAFILARRREDALQQVLDEFRSSLAAQCGKTLAAERERDDYRTKGAAHIRVLAINNDNLRAEIAALQRRVKELEASLELRWADIAHLDTKLADVLDRVEQVEAREKP